MLRQLLGAVELEPGDDAEAVAQRVGQHAGAGGRADQGEGLQVELDRARRRAVADHDVDLVVLERRIEDLLDHRREPMDLVDEEHVVLLEVGQDRRQVLGLLQHRARGRAQVDAELVGDDVAERRLAEAGRAEQQHVVHRLAAHPRRADEDLELLARLGLADVLGAGPWAAAPARSPPRRARPDGRRRPAGCRPAASARNRRSGSTCRHYRVQASPSGPDAKGPQCRWPAAAASLAARRGGAHRHFQPRDAGSTGAIDELEDQRHGLAGDQGLLQVGQHEVVAARLELDRLARRQIDAAGDGAHPHHVAFHLHLVDLGLAAPPASTRRPGARRKARPAS